MELFQFKKTSFDISGDYYQISFDNGLDIDDEPYFLVQCDFEDPSSFRYVECHDRRLCGHHVMNLVEIGPSSFTFHFGKDGIFVVKIEYSANPEQQDKLIETAKVMFDNIRISDQ